MRVFVRFRDVAREGRAWALRAVAALVVAALVLPVAVSAVAEIGHGVYHVTERMSLDYLLHAHSHGAQDHVHDSGMGHAAPSRHTHHAAVGSAEEADADHDHSRAVDLLLTASADTPGSALSAATQAPTTLDLHVPSSAPDFAPAGTPPGEIPTVAEPPADRSAFLPDPPPPRA